jgi:enterochelin esterase-like enzyme
LKPLGALAALLVLTASCSVPQTDSPAAPTATASLTTTPLATGTATLTPSPSPSPTLSPSPTPACLETHGRVESISYPGLLVRRDVPVRVYLPPCYPGSQPSYPVLYLLHGKPFTESHWDDLGADEAADGAIAVGDWVPFLIVMPLQPEPLFSSTDGGEGSYEQELLEGLVPFIDRTYRTDRQPGARALAGISRGGVWALEIGLRHSDMFGGVGALSPALSANHARPEFDPLDIVAGGGLFPARIYLGAGDSDWARRLTVSLANNLGEAGARLMLAVVPGGHQTEVWVRLLRPMMSYLVTPWRVPAWPEREELLLEGDFPNQ